MNRFNNTNGGSNLYGSNNLRYNEDNEKNNIKKIIDNNENVLMDASIKKVMQKNRELHKENVQLKSENEKLIRENEKYKIKFDKIKKR